MLRPLTAIGNRYALLQEIDDPTVIVMCWIQETCVAAPD